MGLEYGEALLGCSANFCIIGLRPAPGGKRQRWNGKPLQRKGYCLFLPHSGNFSTVDMTRPNSVFVKEEQAVLFSVQNKQSDQILDKVLSQC